MSTPAFILRNLRQTLVYWANPVSDGFNGFTYDDPVEIKGRCEFTKELVLDKQGEESMSQARVFLAQEVQEGEYLYLGTLATIDSAPVPDTTEGSMRVLIGVKTPRLGSITEFEYKAFLNTKRGI